MSKFPKPIPIPMEVHQTRLERYKHLVQSAKLGIKIRIGIILFELVGVVLTQSAALFLDVVSSFTDVLSTIFLIICIKLAKKPPDSNHPFGHGRFEPLGGLLLGALMIALGGVMLVQQFLGTIQEVTDHQIVWWAWIFPAVAVVALEFCYRVVMYTAKKQNSPALAADAFHYRIDGLTSLFALVALTTAFYFPNWSHQLDHLGALLIAVFMMIVGFISIRDNFHQLVDKAPDKKFFKTVKKAASRVKGVKATEKIRIQLYGPDAHVDIDVEVDPKLSVEVAHRISQQVRSEIQKDWPAVQDVTVHIEPFYANDH